MSNKNNEHVDIHDTQNIDLGSLVSKLLPVTTFGENIVGNERTAAIRALSTSICIKIDLSCFHNLRKKYSDTIICNGYLNKILQQEPSERKESDVHYLSDFLLQIRFFRSLPNNVRYDIGRVIKFQNLKAGEVASTEGLEHNNILVVVKGALDIYTKNKLDSSVDYYRATHVNKHKTLSEDSYSTSSGGSEYADVQSNVSDDSEDVDVLSNVSDDSIDAVEMEEGNTKNKKRDNKNFSKMTQDNLQRHDNNSPITRITTGLFMKNAMM
eukprot:g875.t1